MEDLLLGVSDALDSDRMDLLFIDDINQQGMSSGMVAESPIPGALDALGPTVYNSVVGAFAVRRLFSEYTGPEVRIRRSTDQVLADIWFDDWGTPLRLERTDGTESLLMPDLHTWLNGAKAYLHTWYDQGISKSHLTQYTDAGGETYVVFQGNYIEILINRDNRRPGDAVLGDQNFGTTAVDVSSIQRMTMDWAFLNARSQPNLYFGVGSVPIMRGNRGGQDVHYYTQGSTFSRRRNSINTSQVSGTRAFGFGGQTSSGNSRNWHRARIYSAFFFVDPTISSSVFDTILSFG